MRTTAAGSMVSTLFRTVPQPAPANETRMHRFSRQISSVCDFYSLEDAASHSRLYPLAATEQPTDMKSLKHSPPKDASSQMNGRFHRTMAQRMKVNGE